MSRLLALVLTVVALAPAVAAALERESRTIVNDNVGRIRPTAPKDWAPVERTHTSVGTTFYRLVPPDRRFDVAILFNDKVSLQMPALVDADLERYIASTMAERAQQSIEGRATVKRFGARGDGVYARLTHQSSQPGRMRYLTQGVRLTGAAVVLFTLYSADEEGATLAEILAIIESVTVARP